MIRVLQLIKGLGRGGAEQIVAAAANAGRRYDYEVAYLLSEKDALVPSLEREGIPVHHLNGNFPVWLSRLRRLIRDREIALVHVHSPVAAVGARLALRHTPVVYTEHNVWGRYHPITRWANARTIGLSNHVFAVSREVEMSIRESLKASTRSRIEMLHHGSFPIPDPSTVDEMKVRAEFGLDAATPFIVMVANFKKHKGHSILVEAIKGLVSEIPDLRCVFVGTGQLEGRIRAHVKACGLEQTILFVGFREDAIDLIGAADLFVLPSWHEGLPIALLEAMALGTATIATAVGGIPEAITHQENGLLVAPGDPMGLADAIRKMLEDRDLRNKLGHAARRRARDFDMRRAIKRMEDVYSDLLELRVNSRP